LSRQWGAGVLPEFPFNRAEAWFKLVDHFELEDELFDEHEDRSNFNVEELVRQGVNWTVYCIKLGLQKVEEVIDFEDMIYVVLAKNLRMWQYDVVLVDECQDINPTRRALVRKMMRVGGRAIFVGDPRQAIFGFTGADSESVENIVKEFGCTSLPLTYSFRCPKSVVKFAQQWVSHIQSTPDAPEGKVEAITEMEFFKKNINVNDVVLCRNNAPLIDLFFNFLGRGIPTYIEGKDIADDLIKLVNRYTRVRTIPALLDKLVDYKEKQVQKWNAAGKEERAERIADSVDAIVAIAGHLSPEAPVSELKTKIQTMFRDGEGNRTKMLTLTTIHKAKGRDWKRVFWYGRNRWNPSPYARKEWQRIAEDNLCYVAATRSQDELYDVIVPKPPKKRG
jgi:superfamily I DNA/RNA helicase